MSPQADTDGRHPLLVSVADAARALGLGRSKVYDLLADGALESVKIGDRRLIVASSVEALVDRLRAGTVVL